MATSLCHIDLEEDETAMLANRPLLQDSHGFVGALRADASTEALCIGRVRRSGRLKVRCCAIDVTRGRGGNGTKSD
jgi:hypothetical protein